MLERGGRGSKSEAGAPPTGQATTAALEHDFFSRSLSPPRSASPEPAAILRGGAEPSTTKPATTKEAPLGHNLPHLRRDALACVAAMPLARDHLFRRRFRRGLQIAERIRWQDQQGYVRSRPSRPRNPWRNRETGAKGKVPKGHERLVRAAGE